MPFEPFERCSVNAIFGHSFKQTLMYIFVIGPSGVGKTTTLVPQIVESLKTVGVQPGVVEAGGWVRENVDPEPAETFRERLTEYACEKLSKDRNVAINWIREKSRGSEITVVAGVRSPFDFGTLFDWTTDVVVWIRDDGVCMDPFDAGIDAIGQQIDWASLQGFNPCVIEGKSRRRLSKASVQQILAKVSERTP